MHPAIPGFLAHSSGAGIFKSSGVSQCGSKASMASGVVAVGRVSNRQTDTGAGGPNQRLECEGQRSSVKPSAPAAQGRPLPSSVMGCLIPTQTSLRCSEAECP
jgi:hypothetical protein